MAKREQSLTANGVEARLDMTNRLLAALLTRGEKKEKAICTLAALKFTPSQIATVLDVTPDHARSTINRAKRNKVAKPRA